MSAHTEIANWGDDSPTPGGPWSLLERATASLPFWLIRGLALLVVVPILVLGLVLTITSGVWELLEDGDATALIVMLLSLGGACGLIGLPLGWGATAYTSRCRMFAAEALLLIGIVTAIPLGLGLLFLAFNEPGHRESALVVSFTCVLAVLVADGLGALSRLKRLAAEESNAPSDGLPRVFLATSLLLIAAAIAIAATLP